MSDDIPGYGLETEFTDMIFGICLVGGEAIGNAVALAVGHRGTGPAFGGECGIALRPLGSQDTTPTAWGSYSVAKAGTRVVVDEYNSAGPYPQLNAKGLADGQVAAAKAVLIAQTYPRATHEFALTEVLAALGYEIIPQG